MTNLALSPTGKRVVVEARGEIFTIPAEKGDIRNLTNSSGSAERDPAWSPDGKYVSYFSDKSGEYKLVIESQDGISTPPREIALPNPTHYYTPSWSPDSKKLLYTDTNLHVWVLDVASGQAKVVGNDPWMVPERTLNPVWSPDSKWVAYSSRLKSLYHAIFVTNVETGETKQVTDGLSDAVWPAWDASGKYLWFLASTDFGLQSQWLDMTSYDHTENFGLYLAVLKKGEASPLLPESDEDRGVGTGTPATGQGGGRGGRGGGAAATGDDTNAQDSRRASALADRSRCQIDFDRPRQAHPRRFPACRRASTRSCARARPARCSTSRPARRRRSRRRGWRRQHAHALSAERSARGDVRRRASPTYDVSADGHKLVYRTGGGGGGGRGGAAAAAPATVPLFLVDADRNAPQAGQGRLDVTLRMYLEPKEEFKQIFNEGWRNQRDYLYVPNMHGTDWAEDTRDVRQAAAVREPSRRSELPARHDGRGDRDRPLVRARRRHARGADMPCPAGCSARTSRSTTAATRSRASTTTRAGIRICARRSRRRAST